MPTGRRTCRPWPAAIGRRSPSRVASSIPTAVSDPDGSFRLGVPPGPGHLLIKGPTFDYITTETSDGELESGPPRGGRLYPDGLLALDLKSGADVPVATIRLRRGVTLRGRVVGPDDRPVGDAEVFTRSSHHYGFAFDVDPIPIEDGEFELTGFNPEKPATAFFLDLKHQLGAVADLSGRNSDRPLTVRLDRCGSARARFVDPQGKPFANLKLAFDRPMIGLEMIVADRSPGDRDRGAGLEAERTSVGNLDDGRYGKLTSDAQGRVTFPTLIPGATYHIMAAERGWVTKKVFEAQPGQTLELGDITVEPES